MAIALGPHFTQRVYSWTAWKAVQAAKNLIYQYDDDGTQYVIWGYDGPEVHMCSIFKNTVPYAVVNGGYSQSQNDTDKSDFETNYKTNGNKPINVANVWGASDSTKIGNVGDSLKVTHVNDSSGSGGGPNTVSAKLRYLDMAVATGGVARGTVIAPLSGWVTLFSYSGSGAVIGFDLNLALATSGWFIRLVVDGNDIFGSTGISTDDLNSLNIYNLGTTTTNTSTQGMNIAVNSSSVFWSGTLNLPIKYTSSVSVQVSRGVGLVAKTFNGGLMVLTKET